ncbi:MAG TPA: hemerythrin domain-containing protein [Thermoanaerobaculia bacterium]|nr:hemerythrin domain-containing protein [Thermoanaerobaculia bacterium]
MAADLHEFLSGDHDRLDALLGACLRGAEGTWEASYAEFRAGLLRHMAIEERVLFPELRKRGVGLQMEQQLHRDHAALAALLVPPPSRVELEQIAAILTAHNDIEENEGGLYELVESLAAEDLGALMTRVHAIPEVRLAPHVDNAKVRGAIAALLRDG